MNLKALLILFSFFYRIGIAEGEVLHFRKHNMSNGLSHNSAIALLQTRDGFVWIGTRDGLCRFDGLEYKIFKTNFDNQNSISNNSINTLFEDSGKNLWIGTAMGLNRYCVENERFVKFIALPGNKGISHNYIRAVIEDDKRKIFIGSPAGIDIFTPADSSFKKAPCDISLEKSDKGVFCFLKDSKNRILVGTRSGLCQIRNDSLIRYPEIMNESNDFLNQEIRDIKEDGAGRLWIATEWKGLYVCSFNNETKPEFRNYTVSNSKIISDHVRKILIHGNKTWVGTIDGLSLFDLMNNEFANYQYSSTNPEGLSNNSIRDILADNQGGIWIATYAGGVNYHHPLNNLFPHFQLSGLNENFQSTNVVSGFLEEPDGNLWIGTEGSGLVFIDQKRNVKKWYVSDDKRNSLVNNNIKSLIRENNGNLWIGTYNGLSYFDRNTGEFLNFRNNPELSNSLANNQVHALFLRGDSLWIGTNGAGLQVFNTRKRQFSSIFLSGVKNLNTLLADGSGNLWIGHQAGLACYNLKSLTPLDISSALNKIPFTLQYVQSLFEDKSGKLWIGTQGFGLFLLHDHKFIRYSIETGLPDNTVNAITQDNFQNIWLSTNKGLVRLSFQTKDEPRIKTFTKSHGLQELQYMPLSTLRLKSGELLFGGINGYNRFNPEIISEDEYSPEIQITGFSSGSTRNNQVKNWPLSTFQGQKEIKLNHQSRNITINFLGLNYADPQNTYYRYKLSGIMADWCNPTTERKITFNYLPSGVYLFSVQTSTNPSVWKGAYKNLTFTILPPWWETKWAFAVYVILLILLLGLFFQLTKRWINLNNQLKMEHFQREKEEELHRLKQEFFTDISHELRTPLTLISVPLDQVVAQTNAGSPIANHLALIKQNVIRMTKLITNFLDLQKVESGLFLLNASENDLIGFAEIISKPFADNAEIKQINFQFDSDLAHLNAWFDIEKMEIILYNLLSNALKNTPALGKIIFSIHSTPKNVSDASIDDILEISVWNSGKGIPVEMQKRIFERFFVSATAGNKSNIGSGIGLELTRRLVELHHGRILVESREQTIEKEGYTCFIVQLPKGKQHLQPNELLEYNPLTINTHYNFHSSEDHLVPRDNNLLNPVTGRDQVLVVEDNTELRSCITAMLAGNYQVLEAGDGKEGLEIAFEFIPDLIISDIMMPEMNGLEMCNKLKSDFRTSHVPVILLTARAEWTDQTEGLESGANDYVTKPFNAEALMLRVRNILRQRELMRAYINRELICEPQKIQVSSADDKLLKKAVDYINLHLSESGLNVENLATELGLSRVHLYRKIKALTNLTAVEFIRNIRLKNAEKLLRDNKLNINEISIIVGFSDVDYFRDCFKELYGMAPKEYQKNHSL